MPARRCPAAEPVSLDSERPSRRIEGLPAPLAELPWSADFVMQAIEILPVTRRDGDLLCLRPDCADSFVVGWPAGARPEEVAARALEGLGLEPVVLHSTSWRHAGAEVVLTYLAVVSPGAGPPPSWDSAPVAHAELARGDATTPPPAIGVLQVLEHALRHLAWLVRDDPAIAGALPDWSDVLAGSVPEPFRAFGGPEARS
jgi:hypothetical protein